MRIKAAALNFFDTLIIAGKYQQKPPFPFSPAAEFAGVVESVGAGVTELSRRRPCHGHHGLGRGARGVAAPARQLVKLPDALDFEHAAGLSVTYGTTLYALRERAQLKAGETLAVLGAPAAPACRGRTRQDDGRARHRLRIIGRKLAFARAHGADETVNYAKRRFARCLKKRGGEHGIDVVYDPVGGPYAEPAVRSLAWQGRYLVVGFTAGEIPKIPLNLVLLKSCDIRGVFWGSWSKREPQAQHALLSDVARWAAEGKLSAHVHAVYPLADIAEAMRLISDRKVMGKIVLRP